MGQSQSLNITDAIVLAALMLGSTIFIHHLREKDVKVYRLLV